MFEIKFPFMGKRSMLLCYLSGRFILYLFNKLRVIPVSACSASDLQSTYILYPGSGIDRNNDYVEVTSVGGCKQACTAIPTCLNFEKRVSLISTCYMAEVTALDVPNYFRFNDDGWNFYQRNCA